MTHLSAPRCSSHCRCMIIMKLRGRGSVPLDPHADLGRGTRLSPRACAASRDEQGCSRGVCGVGHGARDMGRDGREGQREERHAVVAADSPKRARAAAAAAAAADGGGGGGGGGDRSGARSLARSIAPRPFPAPPASHHVRPSLPHTRARAPPPTTTTTTIDRSIDRSFASIWLKLFLLFRQNRVLCAHEDRESRKHARQERRRPN